MSSTAANSPILQAIPVKGAGPCVFVKDTIDIAGLPTCCGSRALAGAPPAKVDAQVVAQLRAAGWQIAGKTKLHEFAFGTTGINHHDGTPINPFWPQLIPGGSSSGSASAVAAGLAPLALGTDTGGSVRTPAACCGVFGLKPTYGLVSRVGVAPPASSLDCVGPFACDMETLIAGMRALVPGFEPPVLPPELRVGVLQVEADAMAGDAASLALGRWAAAGRVVLRPVAAESFGAAYQAGLTVINAETWAACGRYVDTGLVGADLEKRLRNASATTAEQLAQAEAVRRRFTTEIDALLQSCQVLALPTLAGLPPRLEDAADTIAAVKITSLVRPFNLSGHPAITVPLPSTPAGPMALQLVAARGADALLCAIARDAELTLGLKMGLGAA